MATPPVWSRPVRGFGRAIINGHACEGLESVGNLNILMAYSEWVVFISGKKAACKVGAGVVSQKRLVVVCGSFGL
jgi:hypothetical protein